MRKHVKSLRSSGTLYYLYSIVYEPYCYLVDVYTSKHYMYVKNTTILIVIAYTEDSKMLIAVPHILPIEKKPNNL